LTGEYLNIALLISSYAISLNTYFQAHNYFKNPIMNKSTAALFIYKFVRLPHISVVFGQAENWNGVYSGL
jgi:hypothetical protein